MDVEFRGEVFKKWMWSSEWNFLRSGYGVQNVVRMKNEETRGRFSIVKVVNGIVND